MKIKNIAKKFLLIFLLSAFVLIPLSICFMGINDYARHLKYKDTAITVPAKVTSVRESTDSDGDLEYRIYISYNYEGNDINKFYTTVSSKNTYKYGEIINIKLNPDNPEDIIKGKGTIYIFFMIAMFSVGLAIFMYEKSFYKLKCSCEKQLITTEMILTDLTPKGFIGTVRAVLFASAGFFGLIFFTPDLSINIKIPGTLGIIGFISFVAILIKIKSLKNREIILNTYLCEKKWEESDSETTTCYVQFNNCGTAMHGRKIYEHAEEKHHYYVVTNTKGKILEIYDVGKWHPSFEEDKEMVVKKIILKFSGKTILGTVIMFFVPAIIHYIALIILLF